MAANKPLWVGGFALGGLALAALAIVLFSGRRLFTPKVDAVVVFNGSVTGLTVGSIVTFRGVPVGTVKGMRIEVDTRTNTGVIPVELEMDTDRISWAKGESAPHDSSGLSGAVAAGLRAQLVSRSLVTGQLEIDLDLRPDVPPAPPRKLDGLLEIPTIPSDLQDLKDEFRNLDLPGIAKDTRQTLAELQKVLADVDARVGPVADSLTTTLDTSTAAVKAVQAELVRTLAQVTELAAEGQTQLAANGKDLDELIQATGRTAAQAEKLVATLSDMTAPRSPLRGNLEASLRDLAASADSLRTLTRELERNPAGTLFGKASP
jgi:paraquat-inducible protein B